MFFNDHPPPHFHARYGEFEATVEIGTLEVLEGQLPRRALNLVREWAMMHREELLEDWRFCGGNTGSKFPASLSASPRTEDFRGICIHSGPRAQRFSAIVPVCRIPFSASGKGISSGRPSAGINRHAGVSSEGWRIQWEPVPPG